MFVCVFYVLRLGDIEVVVAVVVVIVVVVIARLVALDLGMEQDRLKQAVVSSKEDVW